jgi:hypothetical protein
LVQVQFATERLQVGQEANKVPQPAAQPIDGLGRDHVDLAGTLIPALGAADAGVLV